MVVVVLVPGIVTVGSGRTVEVLVLVLGLFWVAPVVPGSVRRQPASRVAASKHTMVMAEIRFIMSLLKN